MIKLNRTSNNKDKNMITVRLKLKDDKYYKLADETFIKANMKKEDKGLYVGNEDTFVSSFLAIRELLLNKGFVETINTFTRDCGDSEGEEDAMEFYKHLIERGEIYAN